MRPLEGIRVLDFTHVVAGPVCTRLLVDLGAEVLKVESHERPDSPWSSGAERVRGRPQSGVMMHRGKKSIALDLKHPGAAAIARRLASVADVVVENFSAGVMQRLGLGYDDLARDNPGLVFVSMSGFGNTGPHSHWASFNMVIQASSGSMFATGREGMPPVSISNSWMDYVAGIHAAFATLEGLAARRDGGRGRFVDLSQFEVAVSMLGPLLVAGIADGAAPPRRGNRAEERAPQGVYRCQGNDRWCAIAVRTDAEFAALAATIGRPELAAEPRFATAAGRSQYHDEIDAAIAAWTACFSPEDVAELLQSNGVTAEPMRTASGVLRDVAANLVYVPASFDGHRSLVSYPPIRFIPHERPVPAPPPQVGEDGEACLRAWLGSDDAAIAELNAMEASA